MKIPVIGLLLAGFALAGPRAEGLAGPRAAGPAGPRAAGDAANDRGDHPGALAAWRSCAAEGSDRDARYCATRAAVLAEQAADAYAGWSVLEGVRRDYRTIGSDRALATVAGALERMPGSPAAPAMRMWIANERARRGEAVEEVRAAMAGDSLVARAWIDGRLRAEAREETRRAAAGIGAGLAALHLLAAARGPGALRWRSAAIAALMLGVIPAVFAGIYESGAWLPFLRSGAVVAIAVLLAARVPRWIAAPGTLGGLTAAAWWNGWLPSWGL